MHLYGSSRCRSKNRALLFFRGLGGVRHYTAAPEPIVCGCELRKRSGRSSALFREQRSRSNCVAPEGLPIPIEPFLDPLRNTAEPRPLATSRLEKAYGHRSFKCRSDSSRHQQTGLPAGNLFPIRRPTQPRRRVLRRRRPNVSSDGKSRVSETAPKEDGRIATVYATEIEHYPAAGINVAHAVQAGVGRHRFSNSQWRCRGGRGGRTQQQGPTMKSDNAGRKFFTNGCRPIHHWRRRYVSSSQNREKKSRVLESGKRRGGSS